MRGNRILRNSISCSGDEMARKEMKEQSWIAKKRKSTRKRMKKSVVS